MLGKKACLSRWLIICRAKVCARFCSQTRRHADRSSVTGEGGGGTESKHPVRAPVTSGRASCIPRDPSAALRPAFAHAALAQDDPDFVSQPDKHAMLLADPSTIRVSSRAPFF